VCFAVLDNDQIFLKVNDATRPAYQALGAGPFDPMPDRSRPMTGYFELPAAVLEDREQAVTWARGAVAVAHAAAAGKPRRPKKVREAARATSRDRQRERGARSGLTPAALLEPFPPYIRTLANKLRTIVKKAAPSLSEAAYPAWKAVGFRHAEAGYVCGVFPSAKGVKLVFEHGAEFAEPVKYISVATVDDIDETRLTRLVRAAVSHGLSRT
jgi:TfoX/Sxy family transcriptional regulator of competence genes